MPTFLCHLNPHPAAIVVFHGLRTSGTFCALYLLLAGCGGSATTRHDAAPRRVDSDATSELVDLNDARDRLIFEVDRWLGARYRYGGTGESGFDCSGFVRRVVGDAFGEKLPRTTREQLSIGSKVGRDKLSVGDLVFFRTSSRTNHVGVYLGDGEFAHSSSSSGVTISHLADRYWSKAYTTARRILTIDEDSRPDRTTSFDDSPDPDVIPPSSSSDSVSRVGW